MAQDPRIGFCCTFVSPEGDADEERRLNMRRVTLGYLARQEPAAAFDKLAEVVAHNLDALDAQLAFTAARPTLERMFRLVSGFLPGWSHAGTKHLYADADLRELIELRLAAAGAFARANGVRLSMHPGQHAILATLREAALANAITDIVEHVEIMEMLGLRRRLASAWGAREHPRRFGGCGRRGSQSGACRASRGCARPGHDRE